MKSELVSIIVPIYNVEQYLEKCIRSLLNQTIYNIEILLIDDGSEDSSGKICDQCEVIDKRIKVFHTQNVGVSEARNKGIEEAHGEWLCFVDGDDYAPENMVENLLNEVEEDIEIIIGDYCVCGKKSKLKEEFFFKKGCIFDSEKELLFQNAMCGRNGNVTNVGVPWGKLYKTDFIKRNRIQFPPKLKRMQDMIFNLKAFNEAKKIKYIHESVYIYRIRDDSKTHKYDPDFHFTAVQIINELKKLKGCYYKIEKYINVKRVGLFLECVRLNYASKDCKLTWNEKKRDIREKYDLIIDNSRVCGESKRYLTTHQTLVYPLLVTKRWGMLIALMKIKLWRDELVPKWK